MKRDIEFLFELGTLRYIDRTWKQFLSPGVANNAEHVFRVAWIAFTLAKYEKGKVNQEKILKMALLHDITESRTGDVNYLSRQYTKRNEEKAIHDMVEDTVHEKELLALAKEYEERKTLESRIVKDADNLDVELEIRELIEKEPRIWKTISNSRNKKVLPILYTETAKKFWKNINKSNPHDWHLLASGNRFNGGDWKKKK
jgi:putative hydrolase of HD superfamily